MKKIMFNDKFSLTQAVLEGRKKLKDKNNENIEEINKQRKFCYP